MGPGLGLSGPQPSLCTGIASVTSKTPVPRSHAKERSRVIGQEANIPGSLPKALEYVSMTQAVHGWSFGNSCQTRRNGSCLQRPAMPAKRPLQFLTGSDTKFPFLSLSLHPCLALNVRVARPWVSSRHGDTASVSMNGVELGIGGLYPPWCFRPGNRPSFIQCACGG